MKKHLYIFMATLLAAVTLASCGSDDKKAAEPKIYVFDNALTLSDSTIRQIAEIEPHAVPMAVVTVDSIDMSHIQAELDSLYGLYKDSLGVNTMIMTLGVRGNNTCFVKYGSEYNGIENAPIEYSSSDYYAAQVDASIPFEQKLYQTSRCTVLGAKRSGEAIVQNVIAGELLGPLFYVVEPSDGFFYSYIIYPLQFPILKLIDLTGSLYWGIFIFAIIMFAIAWSVMKWIGAELLPKIAKNSSSKEDYMIRAEGIVGVVHLVLWFLPFIFGALTIASVFCFSGLERAREIHEYMGLSYSTIHNIYLSGASSYSFLWMFLALCSLSLGIEDGTGSKIKSLIFICVSLFSCAGMNFTLLLFSLPTAAINFKKIYNGARKIGVGKTESLLRPLFAMSAIVAGCLFGHWAGNGFDHLVGASGDSVSQFEHQSSCFRTPQQLIGELPGEESADIADYMRIISPVTETSRDGDFATFSFKVDSYRELKDAIILFSVKAPTYNSFHAERFDEISLGEQELSFSYYIANGARPVEPLSIAVEAPELREKLEISGNRITNNNKEGVIIEYRPKSPHHNWVKPGCAYIAPRGSVTFGNNEEMQMVRVHRHN